MVKPKHLGHLVLRVRDLDRPQQFYTDVLGLHETTRYDSAIGTMVFMSAGDEPSHELALVSIGEEAPGPREGPYRALALRLGDGDLRGSQGALRRAQGQGRKDRWYRKPRHLDRRVLLRSRRQRDRGVLRAASERMALGGQPFRRVVPQKPGRRDRIHHGVEVDTS